MLLAAIAVVALPALAQADRRVALIIGNGAYENAGLLPNPVNDAVDLAAALRAIGFEVVEGHDLGKRDLERKIGEFADALAGADVGMFFYSGHGLQVDGRNFVLPIDARLDVPAKLKLEAVPMDDVLDIMEQQTKISLVFLDACRNNPFSRGLGTSTRAAVPLGGLAQFDSARGSFIAFSTSPGSVALDGTGRNSPFVSALLKHIATPGQGINDLMIEVRRDVIAATKNSQRPWEQGSLVDRFEFVPIGEAVARPEPVAPAAGQTTVAALERSVGDEKSVEEFVRGYLTPDTAAIRDTVKHLYQSPATVYGSSFSLDALVEMKAQWFGQWSSWSLTLEPGTLQVTPSGANQVRAAFAMRYDYTPKDKTAAHTTGRARVYLDLIRAGGGSWRITAETSEALQ